MSVGYDGFLVDMKPITEYGDHGSSEDLSSDWDTEDSDPVPPTTKASGWKTIRRIVHHFSPFIQTFKKQRYPWVQLAGHQGNFKPGGQQGTILKKFCAREKEAFETLMNDALKPYVPQYYGLANAADEQENEFIQLEDLLSQFSNPCVMDCKLGVRTYLEEELLKAKEKPKLRKDMYDKMMQIDPVAPTPEEHQLKGITKPRYMVWRETISTTATLGFRIEGVRRSDGSSSKDFKTTRTEAKVKDAFTSFLNGSGPVIMRQYLERLHELRNALLKSQFFASSEVIGSSILFVHDASKACLWMIDFAKTCPLPEGLHISHDAPWSVGNHEDGYLIGLSNLIKIFEDLLQEQDSNDNENNTSTNSSNDSTENSNSNVVEQPGVSL